MGMRGSEAVRVGERLGAGRFVGDGPMIAWGDPGNHRECPPDDGLIVGVPSG
jgi:hypothetical protein